MGLAPLLAVITPCVPKRRAQCKPMTIRGRRATHNRKGRTHGMHGYALTLLYRRATRSVSSAHGGIRTRDQDQNSQPAQFRKQAFCSTKRAGEFPHQPFQPLPMALCFLARSSSGPKQTEDSGQHVVFCNPPGGLPRIPSVRWLVTPVRTGCRASMHSGNGFCRTGHQQVIAGPALRLERRMVRHIVRGVNLASAGQAEIAV